MFVLDRAYVPSYVAGNVAVNRPLVVDAVRFNAESRGSEGTETSTMPLLLIVDMNRPDEDSEEVDEWDGLWTLIVASRALFVVCTTTCPPSVEYWGNISISAFTFVFLALISRECEVVK